MNRTVLIVLAPVVIVVGLAQATFGQAPEKKFITPNGRRPTGLFAPGVMVGKTLYVAGKGDYKPNENTEGKVKNCLNEISKTLKLAGMDLKNVVQSYIYLEDHDQYAEVNKHYAEFFPNDPPSRTTLGVAQVPGPSRLEITCVAYADLSEKKRIGDPPAGLPFSPGILAGDTLYISGKGDQLPGGGHPATFEEQVRQAMRNVEATLKMAGLDFRHVVMSNVFLDRYENLELADKVYNEFFEDGAEPACSTSFVNWIPGGSHVEITCIATTDLASRKVVRPAGIKTGPPEGGVTASAAVWAGNTLYLSALPGAATNGDSRVGQRRRPSPPDGEGARRDPRSGRAETRRHHLRIRLSERHEGLRCHEQCLQGILLARPRGPNLPDAGLRHRQDRRPRPRLIHRGADAVGHDLS